MPRYRSIDLDEFSDFLLLKKFFIQNIYKMKIFISYENMKRDFNGRMLLSKFAKFKNVKKYT